MTDKSPGFVKYMKIATIAIIILFTSVFYLNKKVNNNSYNTEIYQRNTTTTDYINASESSLTRRELMKDNDYRNEIWGRINSAEPHKKLISLEAVFLPDGSRLYRAKFKKEDDEHYYTRKGRFVIGVYGAKTQDNLEDRTIRLEQQPGSGKSIECNHIN